MNYEESRAYIRAAELKKGIVLGLENMRELMRRLGNPQDELKYVHVAGTNGKGSVIAYLYSALSGAGYRVGRYISPAVYSYRERMEVNGEPVSREKFAAYVTRIAEVIDEIVKEGKPHPSVFEIETAAGSRNGHTKSMQRTECTIRSSRPGLCKSTGSIHNRPDVSL